MEELASTIRASFNDLIGEKTFEDILAKSCKQSISNLKVLKMIN